jgi:ariadne-1
MDAPERVMKQTGIPIPAGAVNPTQFIKAKDIAYNFMCDICCDDDAQLETVGLSLCGHRFCRDCYTYYVSQKIQEEGESRRIQCPQPNCAIVVDERTVQMLVNDETMAKYLDLLNRTFVDDNDLLKWCPAPDCEFAVECHVPQSSLPTIVPTVECACSSRFCFGCGLYDHQVRVCIKKKRCGLFMRICVY